MVRAAIFAFALAFLVTGCRTPTIYQWGDYDRALYSHYKNPTEREEFASRMQQVVAEAEGPGAKVPPGCYAEYGYALYEQGKLSEAVVYFKKERETWPESRLLMTTMIANAERQSSRGSAATTSGTSVPAPAEGGR
jgi:hypothetical protein